MNNINAGWEYIKKYLFCESTGLIYDYKHTSVDIFPTAEEIKKLFPNPCGYATGMEDGMINGATMLDACLCKAEKTKDKEAEELLKKLKDGMLYCAGCAGSKGFIPRNITPQDKKSYYPDSSRDQYTMFLFAMHRFLNSKFCLSEDIRRIENVCTKIAERAEKNITKENGYDMLRDDNKKTLVTVMWGDSLGNHEYLRLPMIYIMAWKTSGNKKWLEKYLSIIDEAIEKSLPMVKYWHLYTLQQMQASIIVCMENDPDIKRREKLLKIMNTVAVYCENMVEDVKKEIKKYKNYNLPQKAFRDYEMYEADFNEEGKTYYSIKKEDTDEFFTLQDAANIIISICLTPERKPSEKAVQLFFDAYSKIDFSKHERCVPVHFMQGYYRMI